LIYAACIEHFTLYEGGNMSNPQDNHSNQKTFAEQLTTVVVNLFILVYLILKILGYPVDGMEQVGVVFIPLAMANNKTE
jgi:hypothetical protein